MNGAVLRAAVELNYADLEALYRAVGEVAGALRRGQHEARDPVDGDVGVVAADDADQTTPFLVHSNQRIGQQVHQDMEQAVRDLGLPVVIAATLLLPAVGSNARSKQDDLEDVQAEREAVQEKIDLHEAEADTLRANAKALNQEISALRSDVADLDAEIAEISSRVRSVQARIDATQAEIDQIKDMAVRWNRYGRFLGCTGYPECKTTRKIIVSKGGVSAAKPDQMLDEKCPKCESFLVIKQGRFGEFTACTNYPACKYVKQKSTGVLCPKDGGDIVERKSRRGKVFYGCANYPDCDFVLWNRPVLEPCPKCGATSGCSILENREFVRCLKVVSQARDPSGVSEIATLAVLMVRTLREKAELKAELKRQRTGLPDWAAERGADVVEAPDALALLPGWARRELWLPRVPIAERPFEANPGPRTMDYDALFNEGTYDLAGLPGASVFAGTTAERLLHGSPCAVAVAPQGFAGREPISRIAVGWNRSAEATAALNAATAIARAVGAELRVVEILDIQWAGTPAIIPGSGAELAAHQPAARARASLDEVVAGLPGDVQDPVDVQENARHGPGVYSGDAVGLHPPGGDRAPRGPWRLVGVLLRVRVPLVLRHGPQAGRRARRAPVDLRRRRGSGNGPRRTAGRPPGGPLRGSAHQP